MKTDYKNEHASARVVVNPQIPAGVLEVVKLETDASHTKQGYGTQLMQDICADADIEGVVLMLSPRAFGDGPKDLSKWYERFGFMPIQKKPIVLMARMPQVYMTMLSAIAGAASEAIRG